jgi:6-phosphofructo-2-kinase
VEKVILPRSPSPPVKMLISRLARYLNWFNQWWGAPLIDRRQHKTRIFNVGNRRRLAQFKEDADHHTEHDARFFDPNNAEYTATREALAMATLGELLYWLMEENGSVGILGLLLHGYSDSPDATNSTRARRKMILDRVREIEDLNILFLESICTDKKVGSLFSPLTLQILEANMRLKLSGPDYKGILPEYSPKVRHGSCRSPRGLQTSCCKLRKSLRDNRGI